MRILEVRFKNLNSLVGEWVIDFSHPAYSSAGIFAITGPTGAGKSTVLDAICLALYGRTPRLNKVTKNGNEIMSRRTAECFAEVTFETQIGRFRCHWSQRRSHHRASGDLQSPKHEIADAHTGRLIHTRLRGVAEQIETATGMDFDRFTRSMLLAQGGFAAFLQAAPDERAPILEQITGTEIYSRISVQVHERRAAERKELELLQVAAAGLHVLSLEDEANLQANLARMNAEEIELNRQVQQSSQAINWLDVIQRLEQELRNVAEQQQELMARQNEFDTKRQRLKLANCAMELDGDYAGLLVLRSEQHESQQSHNACLEELPKISAALKQATENCELCRGNLDQQTKVQNEAHVVLKEVRELDLRLQEKKAPISMKSAKISQLEQLGSQHSKQTELDRSALEAKRNTHNTLVGQLTLSAGDEKLSECIGEIRARFEALRDLEQRRCAMNTELGEAETRRATANLMCFDLTNTVDSHKKEFEEIQLALNLKRFEMRTTLGGREMSDWRRELAALQERKLLLDKLMASIESKTEAQRRLRELEQLQLGLTAKIDALTIELQSQMSRLAVIERELSLLETQASLLKTISDFSEARHKLRDGQPCPLCGANDHPFARGNTPAPDEAMVELDRAKREQKAATEAMANLRIGLAEAQKDIEQATLRRLELTTVVDTALKQIAECVRALNLRVTGNLEAPDGDLAAFVQQTTEATSEALQGALDVIQTAEKAALEIEALRDSADRVKDVVAKAEREAASATLQRDSTAQQLARLTEELERLEVQQQKALRDTQRELQSFGVQELAIPTLDNILQSLVSRREIWLTRHKQKAELEMEIASQELQIKHLRELWERSDNELRAEREAMSTLIAERDGLAARRHALLSDNAPDEEETRLATAVAAAEKARVAAQQALNTTSEERNRMATRMEQLEKSLASRGLRLQISEATFLTRLNSLGFTDEAMYLAACLPEEERKHLTHLAHQLETEHTELESRKRENTQRLASERQEQLTDQPRQQLEQQRDTMVGRLRELQQHIGALRQRLQDNETVKHEQVEAASAVDRQKRECSRWEMLHQLIGSADGRKFRNFAQGLTFELMVGHANRQLVKINDRYLLTRDAVQPLELNVIDNYQAGEIRSTKNLSGGESFIISLALALGLSHMASKNVRVDSLFLDEGFGTLDDEVLDTALDALAGLQQDGKLIGVISHVRPLQERITCQIRISPGSGGKSTLKGPGCGRV